MNNPQGIGLNLLDGLQVFVAPDAAFLKSEKSRGKTEMNEYSNEKEKNVLLWNHDFFAREVDEGLKLLMERPYDEMIIDYMDSMIEDIDEAMRVYSSYGVGKGHEPYYRRLGNLYSTYRGQKLSNDQQDVLAFWPDKEDREEKIEYIMKEMSKKEFDRSFYGVLERDRLEAEKNGKKWPEDYL